MLIHVCDEELEDEDGNSARRMEKAKNVRTNYSMVFLLFFEPLVVTLNCLF